MADTEEINAAHVKIVKLLGNSKDLDSLIDSEPYRDMLGLAVDKLKTKKDEEEEE